MTRPDSRDADPPSEGRLMELVARGDREAFTALYDRHATLVYSVAINYTGDAHEAGDISQMVFLSLYQKAAMYNPGPGSVAAWLTVMTRNRSLDRLRRLKTQRDHAEREFREGEPFTGGGVSAEPLHDDESAILRSAVGNLPVEQKRAVELAFFESLTHQEIATRLRQPLGTVKARIRRGLLALRESCGEILRPTAMAA